MCTYQAIVFEKANKKCDCRKYEILKDVSSLEMAVRRRSQGGKRGHAPKFLENRAILCFEKRFSKQNIVNRLKSNILAPPKFLGWLRHCGGLSICSVHWSINVM